MQESMSDVGHRDDPTLHGLPPSGARIGGQPGDDGQRYYTIQRVNGNGGNGKGDGVAGPHKHTLDESDRVKKNSIQRATVKVAKEKKKTEVCSCSSIRVQSLSISISFIRVRLLRSTLRIILSTSLLVRGDGLSRFGQRSDDLT